MIALSTNRSRARSAFVVALGLYSFVSGCGEGMAPESLRVVSTTPASGESAPADRVLRIVFDRYLDVASISVGAIALRSGEGSAAFVVGYDPVDRALLVGPRTPLRPGLGYTLTVEPGAVTGLDGSGLAEAVAVDLRAGPPSDDGPSAAVDYTRDVAPIVEARCGCHGPGVFPRLTPAGLVGVGSARQPGRTLVVPGAPLESVLIERILPDYPGSRGMEKSLSDAERRVWVRWVEGLRRAR